LGQLRTTSMKRKTPKTRRLDRDMFGTPSNRAKTWGKKANCPKLNRKSQKQLLNKNIDLG